MRNRLCAYIAGLMVIASLAGSCAAQVKRRIAVFPFDDRTTANKDMNIGIKIADLLIAKLATNGAFNVYDRQYIDRILAEKNLKYDPNFDSAAAAKSGLMGTVDMVITGQIDSFNANTSQTTKGSFVKKTVETDGLVSLKVTARLISVEKGSIVIAPSASDEQKDVLSSSKQLMPGMNNGAQGSLFGGNNEESKNADAAMRKLVDQAADEVAKQLTTELSQSAMTLPIDTIQPAAPGPIKADTGTAAMSKAMFVGINDGQAFIDKGSQTGIKVGDTGLKGGDGKPILRHKLVCTLTIAEVEDSSAAGKCVPGQALHGADGVPHAGDEVVAAK